MHRRKCLWLVNLCVLGSLSLGCAEWGGRAATPAPTGATATPSAAARLHELVEGYFDARLQLNPIFATFVGDHRFDDRLANNIGPDYRAAALALEEASLAGLRAIPVDSLAGQDRLTHEVFRRQRELAIEGAGYPDHLIPLSQFFSRPSFFAQLGSGNSVHPFRSVRDYENFLGRARDFGVWVDQAIANMREGIRRGVVQPRVLMEKTLPQLDAHVVDDVHESLFYRPITNLPDSFEPSEAERIRSAYEAAIANQIVPSYRKLRDFVRDEYLPHTRSSVGLKALPDGEAWYAYLVRETTTTHRTPDDIHELGLREVARIRGEMLSLKQQLGFQGDLKAFFAHLKRDPRFYFDREDALLEGHRAVKARVAAAVPRLFARIPAADFEIRPVEAFRARAAAAAFYMPPAPDGSRPGVFYVNTFDLGSRPRYQIEALYLHEAVPGHHFQISLTQEIESLPRFRRFGGNTAYVEGWGLYAESLGAELGLYTDPYQRYGALALEMWRAIRLVVDTGMHARGWSRERALAFMRDNSAIPETDAVAEIERYIAIPSQALAYKLGQLEIQKLRARASRALGDAFDVRAFHSQILDDGPLPLDVLDAKLERWLESRLREHP